MHEILYKSLYIFVSLHCKNLDIRRNWFGRCNNVSYMMYKKNIFIKKQGLHFFDICTKLYVKTGPISDIFFALLSPPGNLNYHLYFLKGL
jgi:hypothetical protein